jgi:hypothetical protein
MNSIQKLQSKHHRTSQPSQTQLRLTYQLSTALIYPYLHIYICFWLSARVQNTLAMLCHHGRFLFLALRLQMGPGACAFNAGLLARSQFASERSCDRLTGSRISVLFLGPRTNIELVPKYHVALYACHAALPMVTLKISSYINVTLTFDFDLDQPVHGGCG